MLVQVFFNGKQQLIGVNGLNQVIGYLMTDRLIHHILFFALGNHHHRQRWADVTNGSQRLQPRKSGHIFIEKDNIERLFMAGIDSILSADNGNYLKSLVLQKEDMRLKEINFVVCPEDFIFFITHHNGINSDILDIERQKVGIRICSSLKRSTFAPLNHLKEREMKTVTIDELRDQMPEVIQEVKAGYQVRIYDNENLPLGVFVPLGEALSPRKWHPGPGKLGMLKGTFREVGDGRMTLEEFLGEEI
jgi:antitoxin (DNA-binding transcriptional repressor) of toxin-antitoxin stability system